MEVWLMSPFASERGAVHILFLIFVLVIALVFGALWFIELQANEDAVVNQRVAEAAERESFDKSEYYRTFYEAIAPKLGAGLPTSVPAPDGAPGSEKAGPYVNAIENLLASVGGSVDDPSSRPATLHDAWTPMVNRYVTLRAKVSELEGEIRRLNGVIAERDKQISGFQDSHRTELARLTSEHEQLKGVLDQQLSEAVRQNDNLTTQVRETQEAAAQEREKNNQERIALADKTQELDSEVSQVKQAARIVRETMKPDGRVLSADAGTVFIDVGSETQLRRGTRFRVMENIKGEMMPKGWVVVINTSPGMSECRVDETEPGRSVESGDFVFNPVFDKDHTVHFVFLGAVPGKYNRETAERILGRLGAKVDPTVTVKTDFLVLGIKEGEDEDEITDRDDYKNALRWGIEMIRARDLQAFLQL
jgi:Tfp pilus assembly protein FimT